MNKGNCALKLVNEISQYYDARSKKHQNNYLLFESKKKQHNYPQHNN